MCTLDDRVLGIYHSAGSMTIIRLERKFCEVAV